MGHPKVKRVSFERRSSIFDNSPALCVVTKKLYCTHPENGDTYEIGAFKITIHLTEDPSDGSVHFENLTRIVETLDGYFAAPHIRSSRGDPKDTRPCLGNLSDKFGPLLEEGQYFAVVDLAVQFVESVNIRDCWGKQLPCWPLKRKS
jgi:hypothetical protein